MYVYIELVKIGPRIEYMILTDQDQVSPFSISIPTYLFGSAHSHTCVPLLLVLGLHPSVHPGWHLAYPGFGILRWRMLGAFGTWFAMCLIKDKQTYVLSMLSFTFS